MKLTPSSQIKNDDDFFCHDSTVSESNFEVVKSNLHTQFTLAFLPLRCILSAYTFWSLKQISLDLSLHAPQVLFLNSSLIKHLISFTLSFHYPPQTML